MTSNKPNFVFRCLDQALGAPFVGTSWRNALGDAFPTVEPWLLPAADLATSVPCTRADPAHCAYRIVEHHDGSHTGVCDLGYCPRRTFEPAQLIRYATNPTRLRNETARLLGLVPASNPPAHPCLLPLGTFAPAAATTPLPAVIAGGPSNELVARLLRELFESTGGPRLVIFVSALNARSPAATFLHRIEWPAFTLGDACAIDPDTAALRWTAEGQGAWESFCASLAPPTTAPAAATFPPDLRWSEVTLRFLDGHTVSVTARGVRVRYSFAEMGMEDKRAKRPDVQWELLHAFAEGHGTFDWSNDSASHRIQKRKETLAKKLKDHFGIRADPFRYDKSTGGWQAVFTIFVEE